MKTVSFILCFLLLCRMASANEIDKLKTKEDIQKFLVKKVNSEFKDYDIFSDETDSTDTSSFGKGNFFKLDLDNNGLTDLVINGTYFFAITDNGNGHYAMSWIDRGSFLSDKHTLKNIFIKDNIPLLVIGRNNKFNLRGKENEKADTLIFLHRGFYEYNAMPDNLKVEEINFSTTPCYGTCPIFDLKIKADRNTIYNAAEYNQKKGRFKAIIDTTSYNNLIWTINYIKLASLKDNYQVNWTDDQTVTLEIKFNNGQIKKITDYGKIGTYGLQRLYQQLFSLRDTQKWEKDK